MGICNPGPPPVYYQGQRDLQNGRQRRQIGQMEVNAGRMDKQQGMMQYEQGMREMANGNVAQGQRDMMMGQARMNQGQNEINRGRMDKQMGRNQAQRGRREMNAGYYWFTTLFSFILNFVGIFRLIIISWIFIGGWVCATKEECSTTRVGGTWWSVSKPLRSEGWRWMPEEWTYNKGRCWSRGPWKK